MSPTEIATLAKAIGATLATETSTLIDRRIDERVKLERSFVRELIRAEIEPIRASERQLRGKLAAIERLVAPARRAAS